MLDELADSGQMTNPEYRVKLVDIQQPHDRRAFQAALTAILQDMGKARGDLAKKRAEVAHAGAGARPQAVGKGTVGQAQHPQLEHVRAAPTLHSRALLQRALG